MCEADRFPTQIQHALSQDGAIVVHHEIDMRANNDINKSS
jgi:hypothetical protein